MDDVSCMDDVNDCKKFSLLRNSIWIIIECYASLLLRSNNDEDKNYSEIYSVRSHTRMTETPAEGELPGKKAWILNMLLK